jgi:hypothetical protein
MNDAEQKARIILKNLGFEIQQLDWIGRKNKNWIIFEIKEKELFNPPPFLGTGLNKKQLYLRNQLFKDLGLRTILLVFEKGTQNIYWQYLDILEKGEYFDTKNNIRIYPISNFYKITLKK